MAKDQEHMDKFVTWVVGKDITLNVHPQDNIANVWTNIEVKTGSPVKQRSLTHGRACTDEYDTFLNERCIDQLPVARSRH